MEERVHYVVDASVIVKWLNQDREAFTKEAQNLLEQAAKGTLDISTVDLAIHEVCNALIRGKGLRDHILEDAVETFFVLPIQIVETDLHIAAAAATIAQREQITFYDAVYMALAFDLGVPLVTANPKHQRPLPGVAVIPISELK